MSCELDYDNKMRIEMYTVLPNVYSSFRICSWDLHIRFVSIELEIDLLRLASEHFSFWVFFVRWYVPLGVLNRA